MFHECQEEECCTHTQVEHMVEGAMEGLIGSLRPLPSRVDVELIVVLSLTDVQGCVLVGVWVCGGVCGLYMVRRCKVSDQVLCSSCVVGVCTHEGVCV